MKAKLLHIISLIVMACSSDHVNPTMVLSVVDKSSTPVAVATINLYASQDAYNNGVIKAVFITDANGKFTTTDAQYASGDFIAEAVKGDFITWPPTTVKGGTMDYKLTLADNNVFKELVGQQWKLFDVTIGGTSVFSNVSSCSKDNYLLFYKNLKIDMNEGPNLCAGMAQLVSGTFLPQPKDPASLIAFNSQQVYPLNLTITTNPGQLLLSSALDKVMLSSGTGVNQVINIYKKN